MDYDAETVDMLPFTVQSNCLSIVWVSPEGDILIRYDADDYKTKYALALVE